MKRKLTGLLALGIILSACQVSEQTTGLTESGDAVVTVALSSPAAAIATRNLSSGANSAYGGLSNVSLTDYDLRYQLAVYSTDNELVVSPTTVTASDGGSASFELVLAPDCSYTFVAWADFVTAGTTEDLHYSTADFTNIYTIDSETAQLNDESRDAYYVSQTVEVTTSLSLSLTLTRPFAKLRLVTTDYDDDGITIPDAVSVSYYGCTRFSSLNAVTGEVSGETLSDSGNTTYTGSLASDKEYSAGLDAEDGYRTIAVDYLLAGGSQSTVHLNVMTSANGSEICTTDVSADVPIQRNCLSTVKTGFLTTDSEDIDIDIEAGEIDDWTDGDEIDIDDSDSTSVSYVTDYITSETSGVTTTNSFLEWDANITGTSGAVYAGGNANRSDKYTVGTVSIRTTNSNTGVATVSSPGTASKVAISWVETDDNSEKVVNVYGSNTSYSSISDLFDETTYGTLLGQFTYGSDTTELEIEDEYTYIGVRSNSGGLHLTQIAITWAVSDYESDEDSDVTDNSFSYVSWGNNLGLTPYADYASQYRVSSSSEMTGMTLPIVASDIPDGATVTYEIDTTAYYLSYGATIDTDGTISTSSLKGFSSSQNRTTFFSVIVTVGEGDDAVSKKFPIFFNMANTIDTLTVSYTPFAAKVNPETGGSSAEVTIAETLADTCIFVMDYRRSFRYYNLNGPEGHVDGQPSDSGSFLETLWTQYYTSVGGTVNTGARNPMSYLNNTSDLTAPLAYVDNDNNHKVVVNSDKFKDDYGYANGVLIGQMTFETDGTDPLSSSNQIFPLALWFDTDF